MTLLAQAPEAFREILSPEALEFLQKLHVEFNARRLDLLQRREDRKLRLDAGESFGFLPETEHIRTSDWKVSPAPQDLQDRRVEITGPVDRKMVINALNSGAKVFMADFEDANSPTWENCIQGQINLRDAVAKTISFEGSGKTYTLNDEIATLLVRPRGWHLDEKHLLFFGIEVSASLFDFGLYIFHNHEQLKKNGTGAYFYLPKMESHLEARLWNDVFKFTEDQLGLERGFIRATVLIETLPAAFEMEEILYELREHSAGLNCGRWDYIFSAIKKLRSRKDFILPDRGKVTMNAHMMRSYSKLAIQTCHKRGAHAIGGMSAFIPVKNDEEANKKAFEQVRMDKEREAGDGHDGTWVAHPGMVQIAKEVFDRLMPEANQLSRIPEAQITVQDLLTVPEGTITEQGLRQNINVGIQYIWFWLSGSGAAPINNLMEDAATAEISRTQVWQWMQHGAQLEDGRTVTQELAQQILQEELEKLGEKYQKAADLFWKVACTTPLIDFLTVPGYELLA
ncbi:malate synthase A [Deinococcus roseus]|uniref:Malate synthase n=1 Tax=Deinococcus roseus TaxID=392414 RepID=A0ABQ2D0H9_9DEIO|nr:malate synthase A [Deinococcus roseus]GGJ38893.1 malate synthase [Deinococcus roseus]